MFREYLRKAASYLLNQDIKFINSLDKLKQAVIASSTAVMAALGFGPYQYADLIIYKITIPPEVIVGVLLAPIIFFTIVLWIGERVLKVILEKRSI